MKLFISSLSQMSFLMCLIIIGYLLSRIGVVDNNACKLLSKLENNVFIPALLLGTFMKNLTLDTINVSGKYLLCGFVVIVVAIPIAVFLAKFCTKDRFTQKIYTYGLAFSNFGFMGNAVVSSLFPELFMNYLIFVLPFYFFIYVWAVPNLLIPFNESEKNHKNRLFTLVNPMFISVIIGSIMGLLNVPVPTFINSSVSTLGDCMSPIAMLLTGITIANIELEKVFKNFTVYIVSTLRLFIIPLASILVFKVLQVSHPLALCGVCSLAMPLGLNTIVIPSAYGKDTTIATSMALISHLLSCVSIPIIFLIFEKVFN